MPRTTQIDVNGWLDSQIDDDDSLTLPEDDEFEENFDDDGEGWD